MTPGSMPGEMGMDRDAGRAWGGEGRDCGGSTGGGEALMYGSGIVGCPGRNLSIFVALRLVESASSSEAPVPI